MSMPKSYQLIKTIVLCSVVCVFGLYSFMLGFYLMIFDCFTLYEGQAFPSESFRYYCISLIYIVLSTVFLSRCIIVRYKHRKECQLNPIQ